MASYPPPFSNDPRIQRRILRDQARLQRLQLRNMRRTSVVGPLIVIGIGVLFLLVQLGRIPGVALFLWFARWWPLLLVAFGFIRLFEWFLDQRERSVHPGSIYPPRSLGAGVGFLLALLVMAGVASSIAQNREGHLLGHNLQLNEDNLQEFLGDKHESTQSLTEKCAPGTTVFVNNPHGNILISGTSDDGLLHATVKEQIYTRSDTEAARKAEQLVPKIERNGDQLSLSLAPIEGAHADLDILVPAATSITSTVNHGDIQIHSVKGSVAVTANHGDIDLSGITGTVTAHINNGDSSFSAHSITGDVTLEGRSLDLTLSDISGTTSLNGEFFGTTHLERTSGPVRFHTSRTDMQFARLDGELEMSQNADLTADQIAGPMVLNTRYRNINLERVSGPLSITNRNGSITVSLTEPLGNLVIENRNGEVDLTLPTDAHFTVQAETSNADLSNDFGLPQSEDDDHPKLSGTVGVGGPNLQITTSQADLAIHKGSIAPLPPHPPAPPRLTSVPPEAQRSIREADKAMRDARKQLNAAQKQIQQETRDLPTGNPK